MFSIINNCMFIISLSKVRLINVNLFILNCRMGAVYFISKSKGAVDPRRLKTTDISYCN
jgi:hypothetical protein